MSLRPVSARPASLTCHRWWLPALAVACLLATGCVQRRMTIRSNPPGATVYVDDYEIGTTPISHNFTYYGKRKIRLVKDGYETLTVLQDVPPPWYEIPPLDFVSENLVPGEIRDRHDFSYNLVPQVVVPPEQLLGRAEQLRRGVHAAGGVTAPSVRVNPPQPGANPLPAPPMTPMAPIGPEVIPTPQPAPVAPPGYLPSP